MARLTMRNDAGTILFDTSGGYHWGLFSVVMGNQVNYNTWPYNQSDTIICGAPRSGIYEEVVFATPGSRYYIFRPMHTLPEPAGPRLVLRDAAGKTIYHSGMQPLRIVYAVSNLPLPGTGVESEIALPQGREYAFFATSHGVTRTQSVSGSEYIWLVFNYQDWAEYTFTATGFRYRRGSQTDSYVDDSPSRPSSWNEGYGPHISGIIVDVTNY